MIGLVGFDRPNGLGGPIFSMGPINLDGLGGLDGPRDLWWVLWASQSSGFHASDLGLPPKLANGC